jgi:hypothetical protein
MSDEFNVDAAVESIGADLFGGSDADATTDIIELADNLGTETEQQIVEGKLAETQPTEQKPAAEEPTQQQPTATAPPKTWRAEAAAEWSKVPPTVQAEILKREEDIFKGIEGYKQDASFGKTINQVLAPYQNILRQHNIDPVAQISGLMQAHYTLAMGTPEQKQALFYKLAQDYGVQVNPDYEPPYVPPEVKSLQTEIQGLKSKIESSEQSKLAAQQAEAQKQIEAFATDPKNVHFNDVVDSMVKLLQTGVAKTLEEAYESAVYANPITRAKELARQQAEASKKAEEDNRAKVEAAKKATATNLKTTAKSASAATPLGSIDETLQETLAAIKARQ